MTGENKFRVFRQTDPAAKPKLLGAFTEHARARDVLLAQSDAGKAGGVYIAFPQHGKTPRGATRKKQRFSFWRKTARTSRRAGGVT